MSFGTETNCTKFNDDNADNNAMMTRIFTTVITLQQFLTTIDSVSTSNCNKTSGIRKNFGGIEKLRYAVEKLK